MQARNPAVSTLNTEFLCSKCGCQIGDAASASRQRVTQKAGVLVGTINHTQQAEADLVPVILQQNSLSLSLTCGAFLPFFPLPFHSFFFFKIFLETLSCQSLSAAPQARGKQQQMHQEARSLGDALWRLRGREGASLTGDSGQRISR